MGAARQALRAARSSVSSDDRPALGSRSRPFSSGPFALTVGSCPPGHRRGVCLQYPRPWATPLWAPACRGTARHQTVADAPLCTLTAAGGAGFSSPDHRASILLRV